MAEDTRQQSGAEKQSGSPDSAVFLSDPEEDCCRDDEPPVFLLAASGGEAANRCSTPDPAAMFAQQGGSGGGLDARRLSLLKSLSQDSEYSLDSGGGALFGDGGAEAYLEELGFAGAAYPTIPDRFMPSLIERMADAQLGGSGLNERILLSIGRFRRSLGKRRLFRQLSAGRPCPPPRRLRPDDAAPPPQLLRSNTGPSRYSDERLPSEEVRRNSGISLSSSSDPEGQRVVCEAPAVAIRISDADGRTVTGQPDIPDSAEGPSAPRDCSDFRPRDAERTIDRDSKIANYDGRRADSPSSVSSGALDSESDPSKESSARSALRAPLAPSGALATDARNAPEEEGRAKEAHFDVNDVPKERSAEVDPLRGTEQSVSADGDRRDVSDGGSDGDSVLASGFKISSRVPVPTRRLSLAQNPMADTKLFSSWKESNGKETRFPFDEESCVSRVPGMSTMAQPLPRCRQENVPLRRKSVAQTPLPGSPANLSTVSAELTRFTLEEEQGKSANPSQPGLTDKTYVDSMNDNLSELKSPEIVKLLNRPFPSCKNEYTRSDSLTSFMTSMLHDNRPSAVHIPQPNESSFQTGIAKDIFGENAHRGPSDTEPARDGVLYDAAYRLEAAEILRVQSDHRAGKYSLVALQGDGRSSETELPDDEVRASDDRRSNEDPRHTNRRKRPRLRRMSASLEHPDDSCDENASRTSRSGGGQDCRTPADPVPLQGCADNPPQTVDGRSAPPVPRRAFPEEVFHHCFCALSWDCRASASCRVQREIPADHGTDSCAFLSGAAGEIHQSPRSGKGSSVGLPKTTVSHDGKKNTKRLHDINELHCDSCRSSYVHLVPKLPDQVNWDTSSELHSASFFEGKEPVASQRSFPPSSNSSSSRQRSSTELSASSSYDFFSFRQKFSETKDLDAMNRKSPLMRRACPAPNEATRRDSPPAAVRALAKERPQGAEEEPGAAEAIRDFSRTELLASDRCHSSEQVDVQSAHPHDLTNPSYTFPQAIFREGQDGGPSILSAAGTASELPSEQNDKDTGEEVQSGSDTQLGASGGQPSQGPAPGRRSPSQERLRDLLRGRLAGPEGGLLERSDSASAEFVRSHRNPESSKEMSNESGNSSDDERRACSVGGEQTPARGEAPDSPPRPGARDVEAAPPSEGVVQVREAPRRPASARGASGQREPLLERKMRLFAKLLSRLVFPVPGGAEGGAASGARLRLLGRGPAWGAVEPRAFGSGVRLAVNAGGGHAERVFVSSVSMEVVPAPDPGRVAAMWQQGDRGAETGSPEEARGLRSASRELEELRAAIRKAKRSRTSASRELLLLQQLLRSAAADPPPPSRDSPDQEDGDASTSDGTPDSTALSDLRSKSKREVLEDTQLFQEEVKKVKQETEEVWSARLERMESRLQLQEQELARLRSENRRLSDRAPPPPSSHPPSPTAGRRSACCGRLAEQLTRAERRADELGLLLDQKLIELNKLQIALSAQTKEMIELEKAYVQLQCRLRRGAGKPSALGRLCARTFAPPRSPRPGV